MSAEFSGLWRKTDIIAEVVKLNQHHSQTCFCLGKQFDVAHVINVVSSTQG